MHYREAHQLIPEHVPTLQGARRTLLLTRDANAVLPLIDAELSVASQSKHKALLLLEKGRLLEDELGNQRSAQVAFAKACELEKADLTLLRAAAVSEFKAESWEELERVLEQTASLIKSDTRHRAAVIGERARLVEARRHDRQLATELYNSALKLDPSAPGVLPALKGLHYVQGRWHDLVAVLQHEAELATDPAVRSLAYYRAGLILVDRLGNVEQGLAALERAAAQVPDDVMVLEQLARLYERTERYDGLAGVLQRISERAAGSTERVSYLFRIGRVVEERRGDPAAAIRWYEQALEIDPAYSPAAEALGKLYTRQEQWVPLCTILLNEADASSDAALRAAAHARIARIQEEKLGNLDEAVEHHGRALGLVPGYPPSFKALVRLHTQASRFTAVAELYERAVDEAADAETKISYLFKIGQIHEDALSTPARAFAAYRRILELDSHHLGALHAMQRSAERAEMWKELVEALRKEADQTADPQRSASILHRAAEVLDENLQDAEAAVDQFRRITRARPDYLPALRSLAEVLQRLERWDDLLATYRSQLEVVPRGPRSAALLCTMAELCEHHLGDDDEALSLYRRGYEADPSHTPSRRGFERKLAQQSDWKQLVGVLEAEVDNLRDAALQARTACRVGEIYELRLTDSAKALNAYERALAAVSDFRPAIDGRARLLEQARKWGKLADGLAQEAASASDALLSVGAKFREGEVRRDELGDAPRAIKCFEAVLEAEPNHVGSLLALEPLYAAKGAWNELAQVLNRQAEVFSDAGARVAALHQLAALQERGRVGGPEELKQTYFSILQLVPDDQLALSKLELFSIAQGDRQLLGHVDARLGSNVGDPALSAAHSTRLGEILESGGDASALKAYRAALARDNDNRAAARGLSRLAQRSGDPALLDEAATWESRVTGDSRTPAKLLVKAASVRVQAGENDEAIRLLECALDLDPDLRTTPLRLRELLLAEGQVDRLLDALTKAAEVAKNAERRADLWVLVADLHATYKRDVAAGLAALKRVTRQQPSCVPALMKLAELYAGDLQWENAANTFGEVIAQNPPQAVMIDASLKLVPILDQHLKDEKRALRTLRNVLAVEETNPTALEHMLEIQMRKGEHKAASETAVKLVERVTDRVTKARALTILARVWRASDRISRAAEACEQAVALVGLQGDAATEFKAVLPELYRRGDQSGWARYVRALQEYADRSEDPPDVLASAYLEAGRIMGEKVQDEVGALKLLQRGLSVDPRSAGIRIELVARLRHAGKLDDALAQLRELIALDVSRAQSWRDLYEVLTAQQRTAEAQVAMSPLIVLGQANDYERATLESRPRRFAAVPPRAFGTSEFRRIDLLPPGDATVPLLAAAAEGIGKLHPPDFTRYGLSARDKIGPRTGHPVRAIADRLATIFEIDDFQFYVQSVHSGGVNIEPSDPVSLIAPAYLANMPEPAQIFLLGRAMALVARGLYPVEVLSPQELELVLAAAVEQVIPGFGADHADASFFNDYSKRLYKSLSRRNRRIVEEVASAYSNSPPSDYKEWSEKVRMSAARAGLLLAEDLSACVTLARQIEGDLAGLQGEALEYGMKEMRDLMCFWVSEGAFSVRARLGLM